MNKDNLEFGGLDRLERKLESRKGKDIIDKGRSHFEDEGHASDEVVREGWGSANYDDQLTKFSEAVKTGASKNSTIVTKIFWFSAIFFVLSVSIAAFIFIGGFNFFSNKNVELSISGPASVAAGAETDYSINVDNQNSVAMESATIIVHYPEGTRKAGDLNTELKDERIILERLGSGDNKIQNIRAVFFGEQDSVKELRIELEYRVTNSSATFIKELFQEVKISSAPIIVSPIYSKEINSGQDFTFKVEVNSNSKDTLKDLLVNLEYPFGFVYKDSTPDVYAGNNTWLIPTLKSGEKATIVVSGSIVGQNREEKVFRIHTGTQKQESGREIGVLLSDLQSSVFIKQPFISIDTLIGGTSGDFVNIDSKKVDVSFVVRNNMQSQLINIVAEAELIGSFNQQELQAGSGGFYQSLTNIITWDKKETPALASLHPSGSTKLNFKLLPTDSKLEIILRVRGERILASGAVEEIRFEEGRRITRASSFSIKAVSARSFGGIASYGPIPPKAETPTSYNIIWSIGNSINQVSNTEVRAIVPNGVKFTGVVSPATENLKFNPLTSEVVWIPGTLLPNANREVAFQVELLPSLNQVDNFVTLLGKTTVAGIDKVTLIRLSSEYEHVTTKFETDPTFKDKDDQVVK